MASRHTPVSVGSNCPASVAFVAASITHASVTPGYFSATPSARRIASMQRGCEATTNAARAADSVRCTSASSPAAGTAARTLANNSSGPPSPESPAATFGASSACASNSDS